jgi:hypothetical protein
VSGPLEPASLEALDAVWAARFDSLVALMRAVVSVQRELVEALEEVEAVVFGSAPVEATLSEDGKGLEAGGLPAQARQSQLHARRLVKRAGQLAARAEQLCVEAAELSGRDAPAHERVPPVEQS